MLSSVQRLHSACGSQKSEKAPEKAPKKAPLIEGEIMLARPDVKTTSSHKRSQKASLALVLNPGSAEDTVELKGRLLEKTHTTTSQTVLPALTPSVSDDRRRIMGYRPNDEVNSVIIRVPVYE